MSAVDLSHAAVDGPAIEVALPQGVGAHSLRVEARGDALYVPHCNGRGRVLVDGTVRDPGSKGPLVLKLDGGSGASHAIVVEVKASNYEERVACGEAFRAGSVVTTKEGLAHVTFPSARKGPFAGEAVVFVPRGHDASKPAALLVGVHPWNGTPWTYAAYRELLDEAQAKDVVLLMPSGLGNSLYTKDAEDEVIAAIDAFAGTSGVAVDPLRVSIWGASMGGAGATTIGFHHPDRFAFAASYFGDSKYDLSTYVKTLLGGEEGAHRVNALDVVDNARWLPVWLIHGEADKTSPIRQSEMLDEAMRKRGFKVDFDRVAGMGHEGPLVVKYIARVVDRAAAASVPVHPARVSLRVAAGVATDAAYGVRLVRSASAPSGGDAYADVEKVEGKIRVHGWEGISAVELSPGALGGATTSTPIAFEPGVPRVDVRWDRLWR